MAPGGDQLARHGRIRLLDEGGQRVHAGRPSSGWPTSM